MYELKPEQSISGMIKCDRCNAEIKWRYRIPLKEYGIYTSSYPTDTIFASKIEKNNNSDNIYCVRCRKCDKLIRFEYNKE